MIEDPPPVGRARSRAAIASLILLAAGPPAAAPPSSAAPDLELVALQTAGPGRIGACNAVVARLHNAGTAATAEAPTVRLDVRGSEPWTRLEHAPGPLAPGATVEVWFRQVPLGDGRLHHLEAAADPSDRIAESIETNNTRTIPREPRIACGAPGPTAAPGPLLRVSVRRRGSGAAGEAPLPAAAITVKAPIGAGATLATATTGPDGTATLRLPADARSPVVRVTVSGAGCQPAVRVLTPAAASGAALDLDVALDCWAGAAPPSPALAAGTLEVEAALPGFLELDDGERVAVIPGSRLTLRRPGASVRVRATSAHGTLVHDTVVAVPTDRGIAMVVDAPPLRSHRGGEVVEDLRTGLWWTAGAADTASFSAAAALCEQLERGGADWRMPDIDELVFVLEARAAVGAADGPGPDAGAPEASLGGLSACCLWSATEHAGGRLTFYLGPAHIYGRRAEEAGIGALCVRGTQLALDPLLVPERYRDRLPGARTFRPRN